MNYTFANFRYRKVKDKYLVTTDHGSCISLNEEKFKKLKHNIIDDNLKNILLEKGILLNEQNIIGSSVLLRNRYAYLLSGASLHIVVVTLRCNMNCIYCHASSKSKESKEFDMDKDTAKKTVDFIFQSPSNTITIEFQGGEPLLNWEIVKYIIHYAKEKNESINKNLRFDLVTNLTLMDNDKLDFLIKNNVNLCTSLDGPEELHNYNRKFFEGNNYQQVIDWIQKINKEYENRKLNNQINALVTLTKKSLFYPKEIIDQYIKIGLNKIHLRFLNKLGTAGKTWSEINYSAKEYLDFWFKAVEYIEELKKKGTDIQERMVDIMLMKMQEPIDPNYLELRSPCGAAIGQLAYDYNGEIYTCDEARMLDDDLFMLGNVNQKYTEILTCDKSCSVINASINDQYICNDCVYKPYCGVCPVCNYAEQGSVIAKISMTDRCKIYMAQFDWVVERFINKKD